MLKESSILFKEFKNFYEVELLQGIYVVVLHATRIPPHIGLIIDKHYHSLTIKGQDCNTSIRALIKNIHQRKIPSLFIKIKGHPTLSEVYLKEHFILNIQQFPKVEKNIATCLSPIKLFFDETYTISMKEVNFLFDLLPRLHATNLIEQVSALFVNEQDYTLPVYTQEELEREIENARKEIKNLTLDFPRQSSLNTNPGTLKL